MVNWLFKKYPRTKKVCIGCGAAYGMVRPNYPYCTKECREKHSKPPEVQHELPLRPPDKNPRSYDVV